jgi:hypothetical protein
VSEAGQKKSGPSDLVNFSQSPPVEAQRTLQRPLLQGMQVATTPWN